MIEFSGLVTATGWLRRRDNVWQSGRCIRSRYGLIGLVGGTLPQLTLFWVAENVPAMVISIVLAVESFIVFVVAALIGLEAQNLKSFTGLSLGLASGVLVMWPGTVAANEGNWAWIQVTLLVPLSYAVEGLLIAAMPASAALFYWIERSQGPPSANPWIKKVRPSAL